MMTEGIVYFREEDVRGAKLPLKCIEKNTEDSLRRWIDCRGLSSTKSETHEMLVRRVKEIRSHGLDKFVYNPYKATTLSILQEHLKQLPAVGLPELDKWTESMDRIPQRYSYTTIVEYLVKRQIRIIHASGQEEDSVMLLPTADKPLVKGYNFFASGQVGEILLNPTQGVVHVRTSVLASMRETRYDVKCVLDDVTGLVIRGECQCPAGVWGKCNHVAALLFAMLDYVLTMRNPDCCTNKAQVWHMPQRKNKKATQSMIVGKRKVQKHIFGKTKKRKGPLEDYGDYRALSEVKLPNRDDLRSDLKQLQATKHDIGILQVIDSSDESAPSDEGDMNAENLTPEEIVVQRLQFRDVVCNGNEEADWFYLSTKFDQRLRSAFPSLQQVRENYLSKMEVTPAEMDEIEKETTGQSNNPLWFKRRCGRIRPSNAKAYCGKGNPVPLVRAVLNDETVSQKLTMHMRYGVEHEDEAVCKYVKQRRTVQVRKCGLFVDCEHGQLAASPDRIATENAEKFVVEVKCLSASRTMTPMEAVRAKQRKSGFPFKIVNSGVVVKESHKYFTQIQMQMAITRTTKCHLVIFTNSESEIECIEIEYDARFWDAIKQKLLDFHATYIVPALVNKTFR